MRPGIVAALADQEESDRRHGHKLSSDLGFHTIFATSFIGLSRIRGR
jgi:hypothetical protein